MSLQENSLQIRSGETYKINPHFEWTVISSYYNLQKCDNLTASGWSCCCRLNDETGGNCDTRVVTGFTVIFLSRDFFSFTGWLLLSGLQISSHTFSSSDASVWGLQQQVSTPAHSDQIYEAHGGWEYTAVQRMTGNCKRVQKPSWTHPESVRGAEKPPDEII